MKFILFLACLILIIQQLDAFCIYNSLPEGKGTFWIRQQPTNAGSNYFSRFSKSALAPGDKVCCQYSNYDCNKSGNKDEILWFTIRRTSGSFEYPPIVVNVPAGGYIDLGGGGDTPEEATIDVFDSNNQPFNYQWKTDHQAGYT